ncbi:MAG: hypothetical protein IKV03_04340 [Alphaproteobacteria bacterium]|nr:hypothetical protein [Alphaproteobacteria bacterium]
MSKKKLNKKKAILSTIWWTIIYFATIIYYVYHNFGINLLSPADLQYKYNGFISGQWSMAPTDTILFLLAVILFIPIWIIGSIVLYKINWSLPKNTKTLEKKFQNKLAINKQNSNGSRLKMPIKLKAQPSGLSALNISQTTEPTLQKTQNTHENINSVVNTVEKNDNDIEQIAQQILEYAQQYQTEGFLNINLDGIIVPIAISTEDETALLITIINEKNSFLSVDINDIEADWFSTLGPIPSPAQTIIQATNKLKAMEDNAQIIPIIVLASGEIKNCDEVSSSLNEKGIVLTRFNEGKPNTLETIESFLDRVLPKQAEPNITNDELPITSGEKNV